MADEVDLTAERADKEEAAMYKEIKKAAEAIPKGTPGECDLCGEESLRLVRGVCAPCRDRHKLP